MTQMQVTNQECYDRFGVELRHTRYDAAEIPPDIAARQNIDDLLAAGDSETADRIINAAEEVSELVKITSSEDEEKTIVDIFTAGQIIEMQDRIHAYLGSDVSTFLDSKRMPRGYPSYVGRLATQFIFNNDLDVSSFSGFVSRHTEPSPNATGPTEDISRKLAVAASENILNQLKSHYQSEIKVELVGPKKRIEGGFMSWEKGIAECQFLILDFVRDQLGTGRATSTTSNEVTTMTVDDIAENIATLTSEKRRLVAEVSTINPILADQVSLSIDNLKTYMVEVFHRGRLGTPRFRKDPEMSRRAIYRVESLLLLAAGIDEQREDQAEIPILDI